MLGSMFTKHQEEMSKRAEDALGEEALRDKVLVASK